jgi:hypothetical protein
MTDLLDETDDDLIDMDEPNPKIWLAPFLSQCGVTRLEANLSGGGDSGAIDDVTYFNGDEHIQQADKVISVNGQIGVAILAFHAPPGTFVKAGEPLFEVDQVRARRELKAAEEAVDAMKREAAEVQAFSEAAASRLAEIDASLVTAEDVENLNREAAELQAFSAAAASRLSEIETSVTAELLNINELSKETLNTTVRADIEGFVTWANAELIGSELEENKETIRIAPLNEINLILSHLTIDDGAFRSDSFLDALHVMIETDAADAGNYYDNEGGSVFCSYDLDPEIGRIRLIDADYTPGEEYGDEEEDDWEPDLGETEDEELEDDDVGP